MDSSSKTSEAPRELAVAYWRLISLFPLGYRRLHGAEVLSHLLENTDATQRTPTRAERIDLIRAAGREWLVAPLGQTPVQRRAATLWLLILLPALLVWPAAISVAELVGQPELSRVLVSVPLALMWLPWLLGIALCIAGLWRAASVLHLIAALVGVVALAVLCSQGEFRTAYTALGWVIGTVAQAVVTSERARWHSLQDTPWARALPIALLATLAVPLAVLLQSIARGTGRLEAWGPLGTGGGIFAAVAIALGAVILLGHTQRQAAPLLTGIVLAVLFARWSLQGVGLAPLDVPNLGNLLLLLALSLGVIAGARWIVNTVDEHVASSRSEGASAIGTAIAE